MKEKVLALAVVAALVGGGALLLNSKSQRHAHESGPGQLSVVVEAKLLELGHTRLTVPVIADVQAVRDNLIPSRLSAYVTTLPLFEGARFKRGDILARLDMTPSGLGLGNSLEADVVAAESTLKAERERLRRANALFEIQGISQEQMQTIEAAQAAAQTRYAVARENLRSATIVAPFDGVVSQRLVQRGDLVTPGKPLLKITDTSSGYRLLVNAPADTQPAALRFNDQLLPLTPWPEAGPQGLRRYEARTREETLLPGGRIDAKLVIFRSPEAVLLPQQCLLNDDGKTATVLALKGGNAEAMPTQPSGHHGAHQQQPADKHQVAYQSEHQPRHQETQAQQHKDHEKAEANQHTPSGGGHHHRPQSAGKFEVIQITLTAHGQEGAVAADNALAGRQVLCGSPDVLSRVVAGVPFAFLTTKD